MLAKRCESNPIIRPEQLKASRDFLSVTSVMNCGTVQIDGETILLVRVAECAKPGKKTVKVPIYDIVKKDITTLDFYIDDKECDYSDTRFVKKNSENYISSISHLRVARSNDGIHFKFDDKIFMQGDNEYEIYGVEDPRITYIDGYYYINYSAISDFGVCTCLARTKDFSGVEKLGVIFTPDNKDAVIFPQKINGQYVALNRPISDYFKKPEIWIAYSNDLLHWGGYKRIVTLRENHFDSGRIGASAVPILINEGWLEIYHGADINNRYCLGALLLDRDNPEKVLARTKKPIMEPLEEYEKVGFFPNVVFSNGAILQGDTVHIYYGAADKTVCYAQMNLQDILNALIAK